MMLRKNNLLSFGSKLHEYDNGDRGCIISAGAAYAGAVAILGHHLCWASYARTAAKDSSAIEHLW